MLRKTRDEKVRQRCALGTIVLENPDLTHRRSPSRSLSVMGQAMTRLPRAGKGHWASRLAMVQPRASVMPTGTPIGARVLRADRRFRTPSGAHAGSRARGSFGAPTGNLVTRHPRRSARGVRGHRGPSTCEIVELSHCRGGHRASRYACGSQRRPRRTGPSFTCLPDSTPDRRRGDRTRVRLIRGRR